MNNFVISKKNIYRKLTWLLLICSVWLTISVFVIVRFDFPLNFSHISVIFSFITISLIYTQKIKFPVPHFYLITILSFLSILSFFNLLLIKPETVTYINKTFLNHYSYKKENYPEFNSFFLFFKELAHLFFAIITIAVSSLVIKKSELSLLDFKLLLQKYLYYLVVFYLIIYAVFFIYEDIILLISTNQYNGFRSFTSVKNQYFLSWFPYRLGITHTEPSFSGLYVLIFTPLIFLKSKYSKRLKILVPFFFLFNSSKYVIAVGLILCFLFLILFLIEILKQKRFFILFPFLLISFSLLVAAFIIAYWEKFSIILADQSGFSRIFSMMSGLRFFFENFILGIGIGQYPIHFTKNFSGNDIISDVLIRVPSAQSMFVNGLAEFGVSYILFILFLIVFTIKIFKIDRVLFFCSIILIFNLNASAGNGFNMIYYWVLLTFFSFYAWKTK